MIDAMRQVIQIMIGYTNRDRYDTDGDLIGVAQMETGDRDGNRCDTDGNKGDREGNSRGTE